MEFIQETVGWQIIRVARAHHRVAERALCALGLHAGQEMVLLHLWEQEGLTQTQLAMRLEIEPASMTLMLQKMERAGLVTRQQDEQDARIMRVSLTEAGRCLEHPVREVWQQLEAQSLSGLSVVEQTLLRRLLTHMATNLQ